MQKLQPCFVKPGETKQNFAVEDANKNDYLNIFVLPVTLQGTSRKTKPKKRFKQDVLLHKHTSRRTVWFESSITTYKIAKCIIIDDSRQNMKYNWINSQRDTITTSGYMINLCNRWLVAAVIVAQHTRKMAPVTRVYKTLCQNLNRSACVAGGEKMTRADDNNRQGVCMV